MSPSLAPRGLPGLAGAVLAGGASAGLFAVALMHAGTALIFLAYLAAVPVFIAGLGAGVFAALIASATGIAYLASSQPVNYAVAYAFINALPCILLTTLALRPQSGADKKSLRYSEGDVLTSACVYTCVVFLVLIGATWNEEGGLLGLTTRLIKEAAAPATAQMDAAVAQQFTEMVMRLVKFTPAMTGLSWVLILVISLVAAQIIVQKQKWNLRPAFAFHGLHVPGWLIFAVAATGMAGAFAPAPYDYIGSNLSIILGLPFFFAGLAIVHVWAALQKSGNLILTFFYLFMTILPLFAVIPVFVGVIDQWANFRQRFSRRNAST
ncbi:MAG: DUF2232 domain-containing protein [Alphaproteobacteria bacterium]|nr:DUF2232 domain-containing protein [Alphaproteobacteria bacterium]